jgi:hypothetical protein
MKSKIVTTACALVIGTAWLVAPVGAADVKNEAKDKVDRVEDKAESKMDKLKDKAQQAKEKISEKLHRTRDRMASKEPRDDVRAGQQALRDRGYDPGQLDGLMGPQTSAALKNFQRAEKLAVTGQFDDATAAKLNVSMRTGAADSNAPSASPAMEDKSVKDDKPTTDSKAAPVRKRQTP